MRRRSSWQRKSQTQRKRQVMAAGLLVILALGFVIIERNIRETVMALALAQAEWMVTDAVNDAVLENIASQTNYKNLILPEKNNSLEQVVFLQANMVAVNKLKSETVAKIQQTLEGLVTRKVSVPLGQVTGATLLANVGPVIHVRVLPVGTVRVDVNDEFQSAGINQTRHRIYLDVQSKVRVVIPFYSRQVEVATKVPVADAIVVGPVPETYVIFDKAPTATGG